MRAENVVDGWESENGEVCSSIKFAELISEPDGSREEKNIGFAIEHLSRCWIYLDKGPKSGKFLQRMIDAFKEAGLDLKSVESIGYDYRHEMRLEEEDRGKKLVNEKDGKVWRSRPEEEYIQEIRESEILGEIESWEAHRSELS